VRHPSISADVSRKVLWENAVRLYDFDVDASLGRLPLKAGAVPDDDPGAV
jgi:hypothetical protein